MFENFNYLFPIMFLLVICIILFKIFKSVRQWHWNNQQPIIYAEATIVSKRIHTSSRGSQHANEKIRYRSNTAYFATFEVEGGERMELSVSGADYGKLAEGDKGELSYQGTRYLGFRNAQNA